ncbi:MAG: hypothetical protein MJ100_08930 [Ruminococcus sp.]|nr:hypothetical protein [Ruminococcus sp.]
MAKNKDLDSMYRELRNSSAEDSGSRLLKFLVGLVMLVVGLFLIFNNITVSSSWGMGGYFFSFGSFNVPNGAIMLPILIGIGMLFFMRKRIYGWIVLSIGVVFVLLSVIMSTRITWLPTKAYIFIIMFGLVAAGGGLVLRELFRKD